MKPRTIPDKVLIAMIAMVLLPVACVLFIPVLAYPLNRLVFIVTIILILLSFFFIYRRWNSFFDNQNTRLEKLLSDNVAKSAMTKRKLIEMYERVPDAFVSLDLNWCYTYVNRKAGEIFNRDPHEMSGKNIWAEFPEGVDGPFHKAYQLAMQTQQYAYLEEFYPAFGLWIKNHIYPSPEGLSIFLCDITGQKKAEERLLKFTRLHFFISHINHMIARTTDELALLKGACSIAVEIAKFKMAWVGMVDEITKTLNPVVSEGMDNDILPFVEISAGEDNPAFAFSGTLALLQEGKSIVCNDIESEPVTWAQRQGCLSSIMLPVKKFGKIVGSFNLYADKKNFFDKEEIALLEDTAGDISFALEVFEKETLRKKAEEAVLESERRYQTLTEVSPVGIFHTDSTGYTTYVNPRWSQISGLSPEQGLGDGWLQAVHEEDRKQLFSGWKEATKIQEVSLSEYRFIRPDGTVAWVIGQAIPEWDAENRIVGYVGTITDITGRKLAEEAIKKAQEEIIREKNLSDSIINSLPGIFYLFDKNGKYLRWNSNLEKVSLYDANEIAGMHPLDFFEGKEKELIDRAIKETFIFGEVRVESSLVTKAKTKLPYYFTGIYIDYQGSPCLLGVGIDFTERVQAQEKIQQTSEQLRKLALHLQTIREEERRRIGREIHDELGQQLTAIKMDIAWIDKKTPEESTSIKNKLRNVIQLLDGSNQSIRRILSELRSGVLEDHGLSEAVYWLARQFTSHTGVPVKFTTPENETVLSTPVANCIFRAYQEAFTNITRYGKAAQVTTSLNIVDDVVEVIIEDDGVGFDISSVQNEKSFGILGMKERVLSLGGKFELVSAPGKGTKITIILPDDHIKKNNPATTINETNNFS